MTAVRFRFRPRGPFSLARTAARFRRFPDPVDRFEEGVYRRLLEVEGEPILVEVEQSAPPSRPELRVSIQGRGAPTAGARHAADQLLVRALGAAADLRQFYRAVRDDPVLGPPARRFRGLRVAGAFGAWDCLVTTVLSQQVNLQLAYAIRADLALRFGRRARLGAAMHVAFPGPERLARVPVDTLRGMRLSRVKAETLHLAATAFASGELTDAALAALPDEEVVARLTQIRGVGRWTAETVLMRGLGRLDAFPAADLGIVKVVAQELLGRSAPASEAAMRRWADRYRPWRALALAYAWAEIQRLREERTV